MPQIAFTRAASLGVERCRRFLDPTNPRAARMATEAILRRIAILATHPGIGRPLSGEGELRELLISYGESGYVALYRYDLGTDTVFLLAFRHQREEDY
ncbi:type II toxin-antitoxin system RelE/ParE family toxin [Bosea sp. PAMC 26642]|uniref:type II toxin-antitoxin system RelE/ParE family toxin n=1 Tax=Bosea sp. (strain PAMC 26642) TaxID=1792307 RepID=UPI0007701B03|nr:type II toxin-antitoxin system RelE/ParE family toxin [Bosea sp. PAMC 26642]AMJ59300.1 plasmid stabilization protein [Bosea sp. PAMC 26642]